MGYGGGRAEMGKAIGKSGDGGIDGIIKEDALGLDVVYVQAKRYAADNSVGRPEVQSFAGSLDGVRATKGIFITTSSFTSNAREFTDKIAKRIILIDGPELARFMVRHNIGVRLRALYEIKKVDEDYFSE
jgi:restriction system protein